MSNRFDNLGAHAGDLAGKLGDSLKDHLPQKAMKWIETGAALGALRTGSRIGLRFARRNPVLAIAAVAGAGALMYAARRQQQKQQANGEVIEGKSTRVPARKIARAKRAAD